MEQNNQTQPPVFNQPQQQQQPAALQYQPRVTARPMMGFWEAVKTCFKKYVNCKGRARRSEAWWYVLFIILCTFVFFFVMSTVLGMLNFDPGVSTAIFLVCFFLLVIILIIPQISVLVRRLHDTGRSGWWAGIFYLMSLIYNVAYIKLMWPLRDKMDITAGNYEAIMKLVTKTYAESPIAASIVSFLGLPTFLLGLVIFVFTLLDSKWGENKYGPSPKYQ